MASRSDIEIPYALRAGTIVHVSEVARGSIAAAFVPAAANPWLPERAFSASTTSLTSATRTAGEPLRLFCIA